VSEMVTEIGFGSEGILTASVSEIQKQDTQH
jgi:hypothetical protein